MTTREVTTFAGYDCALNHGAIVEIHALDHTLEPAMFRVDIYTDKKTKAKGNVLGNAISNTSMRAHYLEVPKDVDVDTKTITRLRNFRQILDEVVDERKVQPIASAMEGYAYGAKQGAHQLGEVGGLVRLHLSDQERPLRIHDPLSIKMWATGRGDAEKSDVIQAAVEQFKFPTERMVEVLEKRIVEDCADAFWAAQMVQTEYYLRRGELQQSSLPEHQLRVVNRVTKSNPVNLLGREWHDWS